MTKHGANTFEKKKRGKREMRWGEREGNRKGEREAVSRIRIRECHAFSMLSAVTVLPTSQAEEDRATLSEDLPDGLTVLFCQ